MKFKPGDRVETASGRLGTVEVIGWSAGPLFELVKLDLGGTIWIRRDLLKHASANAQEKPKRTRRKKAA